LGNKIEKIKLFDVVDFTKADAELSANLEVKAEGKGERVPRFDTMIAAIAINRGFKLFTFNKEHFEGFENLVLF
jgi:predicted nucleic acid-binding protein